MNKLIALSLILTSLLLAACGSGEAVVAQPGVATTAESIPVENTPTTEDGATRPDPVDGTILVVRESGGCFMAGPSCRTISIMGDGAVTIAWGEPESINETTLVDPALVANWLEIAEATDFEALVQRLPEGECNACVDGIDLVFELQHHGVVLDSTVIKFVSTEPFFAATNSLIEAVPFTLSQPAISPETTN